MLFEVECAFHSIECLVSEWRISLLMVTLLTEGRAIGAVALVSLEELLPSRFISPSTLCESCRPLVLVLGEAAVESMRTLEILGTLATRFLSSIFGIK